MFKEREAGYLKIKKNKKWSSVSATYGNAQHVDDICNKSVIRSLEVVWYVIKDTGDQNKA